MAKNTERKGRIKKEESASGTTENPKFFKAEAEVTQIAVSNSSEQIEAQWERGSDSLLQETTEDKVRKLVGIPIEEDFIFQLNKITDMNLLKLINMKCFNQSKDNYLRIVVEKIKNLGGDPLSYS